MNKIILTLALTVTLGSASASKSNIENKQTGMLYKASANSGIHQTLSSKNTGSEMACYKSCIDVFINCINNPYGSSWVLCEIKMENCMAGCEGL